MIKEEDDEFVTKSVRIFILHLPFKMSVGCRDTLIVSHKYLCKSFVTFLWGLILNFQSVTSSKLLVRYLRICVFDQRFGGEVSRIIAP